ncbi:hypothetical protein EO97_12460, partial [Methanosarcina sp. 2.H.T.1A.15]
YPLRRQRQMCIRDRLNFGDIFGKHKSKGLDLNSLLIGLLSYKLTENFSIKEAGKWLNQEEILEILNLERFHERVLYRTLELLGRNREEILSDILDSLFSVYGFEDTNINLDWMSVVLYGTKSKLGKYGYSRDHRPDKLQITVGISELAEPINIPIGVTVNRGNVLNLEHFSDTYNPNLTEAYILLCINGLHASVFPIQFKVPSCVF